MSPQPCPLQRCRSRSVLRPAASTPMVASRSPGPTRRLFASATSSAGPTVRSKSSPSTDGWSSPNPTPSPALPQPAMGLTPASASMPAASSDSDSRARRRQNTRRRRTSHRARGTLAGVLGTGPREPRDLSRRRPTTRRLRPRWEQRRRIRPCHETIPPHHHHRSNIMRRPQGLVGRSRLSRVGRCSVEQGVSFQPSELFSQPRPLPSAGTGASAFADSSDAIGTRIIDRS